jgi:hypothetical protein
VRTVSGVRTPSAACEATSSVSVAKSSVPDISSACAFAPGGSPSTVTSTGRAWSSSRTRVMETLADDP